MDITVNNLHGCVLETDKTKMLNSSLLSYHFDKKTGFFVRDGKFENLFNPFGPEIADIEITTICNGVTNIYNKKELCRFCYKANNKNGSNMSLNTYKKIIDVIQPVCTQVALGADSEGVSNPELEDMLKYTIEKGLIPNITIAEISNKTADLLAKYCGAVAVSCYENNNICYDSVKKLTDRGMTQINIHFMISEETYYMALKVMEDIKKDERLSKLNAIVFLSLKKRGRGIDYNCLNNKKFAELYRKAVKNQIKFGFDSCSANKMYEITKNDENFKDIETMIEPCESTAFSSYFNVDGDFYPCSFMECKGEWKSGININDIKKIEDFWYHEKTMKFRKILLTELDCNGCRQCNYFKI